MERYAVQDGSGGWHAAREECDMTGTSFASACGLDVDKSRKMFWKIRKGLQKPTHSSELPFFVQDALNGGREDEPWAAHAYALSGLLLPREFLCSSGQVRRMWKGLLYGCNLDREIWTWEPKTERVRLLEIKTIQNGEPPAEVPRKFFANLLQLLLQMFCARLEYGDLFYWRRETGEWRCFHVRMHHDAFAAGPLQWAAETADAHTEPPNMNAELRAHRQQYLLYYFIWYPGDTQPDQSSDQSEDQPPIPPRSPDRKQ